jgi:hypothetical protein
MELHFISMKLLTDEDVISIILYITSNFTIEHIFSEKKAIRANSTLPTITFASFCQNKINESLFKHWNTKE